MGRVVSTFLPTLYYDGIKVSEGIVVNETRESKEWDICYNWYFLYNGFKIQSYICNRCRDLVVMMFMNRRVIAS